MVMTMDHRILQLALVLAALAATALLTGAGVYEQVVLDTAWLRKPAIVRPIEGGVNRKLFWVPANIVGLLALVVALWASWPVGGARTGAIIALGFFLLINAVTVGYFAPAVLRVEKEGIEPNAPAARRWVQLSRLRTPLALGVNVALAATAILLSGSS
jgi:hypothetical protein